MNERGGLARAALGHYCLFGTDEESDGLSDRFMGVDFLDFLRSGEEDVHAFAESRRKRRRSPGSDGSAAVKSTAANVSDLSPAGN